MPSSGEGKLMILAGSSGPVFLVTGNFNVIKTYNNSTSYALAVALLGDRILGGPGLAGEWPVHDKQLSRRRSRTCRHGSPKWVMMSVRSTAAPATGFARRFAIPGQDRRDAGRLRDAGAAQADDGRVAGTETMNGSRGRDGSVRGAGVSSRSPWRLPHFDAVVGAGGSAGQPNFFQFLFGGSARRTTGDRAREAPTAPAQGEEKRLRALDDDARAGSPGGAPAQATYHVQVLGDTLALEANDGLVEAFADKPEIGFVNKARDASGSYAPIISIGRIRRRRRKAPDKPDFVIHHVGVNDTSRSATAPTCWRRSAKMARALRAAAWTPLSRHSSLRISPSPGSVCRRCAANDSTRSPTSSTNLTRARGRAPADDSSTSTTRSPTKTASTTLRPDVEGRTSSCALRRHSFHQGGRAQDRALPRSGNSTRFRQAQPGQRRRGSAARHRAGSRRHQRANPSRDGSSRLDPTAPPRLGPSGGVAPARRPAAERPLAGPILPLTGIRSPPAERSLRGDPSARRARRSDRVMRAANPSSRPPAAPTTLPGRSFDESSPGAEPRRALIVEPRSGKKPVI